MLSIASLSTSIMEDDEQCYTLRCITLAPRTFSNDLYYRVWMHKNQSYRLQGYGEQWISAKSHSNHENTKKCNKERDFLLLQNCRTITRKVNYNSSNIIKAWLRTVDQSPATRSTRDQKSVNQTGRLDSYQFCIILLIVKCIEKKNKKRRGNSFSFPKKYTISSYCIFNATIGAFIIQQVPNCLLRFNLQKKFLCVEIHFVACACLVLCTSWSTVRNGSEIQQRDLTTFVRYKLENTIRHVIDKFSKNFFTDFIARCNYRNS